MSIKENIQKINLMKDEAARAVGRSGEDVLLCAVTKTRTAEEINQAIKAGITDIGENKVQEIMDKYESVLPVRWHMIGHLQTNKVKYIIDKVDMIHSVDSLKLAEEIDKRAEQHKRTMDILIQINPAMEQSKFGVALEETEALIDSVLSRCRNIKIRGLMSVAPFEEDPEEVAVYFRKVKELYDIYGQKRAKNLDFKYLSMGMSHDCRVAIHEGSNLIRIGTAIFGERNYNKTI